MDFNDPTFISRAALGVSITALMFSGITLWWNIHQGRKNRGVIQASVELMRSYVDGYGGTVYIQGAHLFTTDYTEPTHSFLAITTTNIGHRPVSIEGVYGIPKFPNLIKVKLEARWQKSKLEETEHDVIYLEFGVELFRFSNLTIQDKTGGWWPVNKNSFREVIKTAKKLNIVYASPVPFNLP